jgi:ABC-type glycerol-3-phosphate transport system substrate-binding protein
MSVLERVDREMSGVRDGGAAASPQHPRAGHARLQAPAPQERLRGRRRLDVRHEGGCAEQSKQAPNVKYMALPETSNTWSMDAALGISAYTENQDAAWQFIKWYIGESNERGIFDAYGLYPASQSLQKALDSEGKLVQFDVTSEQASHLNQLPRWAGWWGPWTTKVTEALRRGINGELTSDQVIDQVATDWNDLKAEYQQ